MYNVPGKQSFISNFKMQIFLFSFSVLFTAGIVPVLKSRNKAYSTHLSAAVIQQYTATTMYHCGFLSLHILGLASIPDTASLPPALTPRLKMLLETYFQVLSVSNRGPT